MSRSPSAPLAVAGGLLLASVVPAVPFFMDSRPFSEVAGSAVHVGLYALTLAGMLALLVAVPRLAALSSRDGRRLPPGLLSAALVATALNAATQFIQLFVTPYLAAEAPALLDDDTGGLLMAGMVGSWVAFLVAWVAVGAVGLRLGVLSRTAGIALIVGALAQPVIGPLAALFVGVALIVIARATQRMRQPETVPVLAGA
jgi:MFS family permease